jgi:predicted RNase H-like HicB family nuclease
MTDPVRFTIETDREVDGRWIAEVVDLPGVMVYGSTEEDAIRRAELLAAEVLADRAEDRE